MDDTLTIITTNKTVHPDINNSLIQTIKSDLNNNLYPNQLQLEWQLPDNKHKYTYLESLISLNKSHNKIIIQPYRKNYQFIKAHQQQKFLILQDYNSYTSISSKLGVIISTLLRLQRNSSNEKILSYSFFRQLLPELLLLNYPINILFIAIRKIINKQILLNQSKNVPEQSSDDVSNNININHNNNNNNTITIWRNIHNKLKQYCNSNIYSLI